MGVNYFVCYVLQISHTVPFLLTFVYGAFFVLFKTFLLRHDMYGVKWESLKNTA